MEALAERPDPVLAAARTEFEAVGLGRSSLDAIARAAGLSRSTLYRRFANKEQLVLAVLEQMLGKTMRDLDRATRGHTPQDAVVVAFVGAVHAMNSNRMYRRIMVEDFAALESLVGSVREWSLGEVAKRVAGTLRRAGATMPEPDLLVVSELLVRVARSYAEIPSQCFDSAAEDEVRIFAQRYLAGLVH